MGGSALSQFKRKRWSSGAVYAMPLVDGSFGICQAIDQMMPSIIYIAVFSYRIDQEPSEVPVLLEEDIISLGATSRQDLNNGSWLHLGCAEPVVEKRIFPNESYASNGYVKAKHSDAGLYSQFASAFHGLIPWNGMYEEDFWDSYLNAAHRAPSKRWMLSPEERHEYRAAEFDIPSPINSS